MKIPDVIPTLTVSQMREVDRLMIEEIGIELIQMMENAGRALAEHARSWIGGDARGRRVVVMAGRGGNGGGGLAAARRLSIWGADVTVVLGQEAGMLGAVPAQQLTILDRIGVQVVGPGGDLARPLARANLVLDALIGYSLRGDPHEPIATLIRAANETGAPTISLDIPSGLDGDSGEARTPTVRADSTLTLALPKAGLVKPAAREWVGELYLADISVPEAVYRRLGFNPGSVFGSADIILVPAR